MIGTYLEPSCLLRRYSSVVNLARQFSPMTTDEPSSFPLFDISAWEWEGQLSVTPTKEPYSIPLFDISSWERGGLPRIEAPLHGPIIRLTIDSRGIEIVERLTQRPFPGRSGRYGQYDRYGQYGRFGPSDTLAFILLEERFIGITALFTVLSRHPEP